MMACKELGQFSLQLGYGCYFVKLSLKTCILQDTGVFHLQTKKISASVYLRAKNCNYSGHRNVYLALILELRHLFGSRET